MHKSIESRSQDEGYSKGANHLEKTRRQEEKIMTSTLWD